MVEVSKHDTESSSTVTKTFYLHSHNAYDHQIWQGGELLWGPAIDKLA